MKTSVNLKSTTGLRMVCLEGKSGAAIPVGVLAIDWKEISPLERGTRLLELSDMRTGSGNLLCGPYLLPPCELTDEVVAERIGRMFLTGADQYDREIVADLFGISIAELTARLLTINPQLAQQLLTRDFGGIATGEDTNVPPDAAWLLQCMMVAFEAFDRQRDAARCWKILHMPFEGAFGEEVPVGCATLASPLNQDSQRHEDLRKVLEFEETGKKVSKKKFRFLDRYNLGHLRQANDKAVYARYGKTSLPPLHEAIPNIKRLLPCLEELTKNISGLKLQADGSFAPDADYPSFKQRQSDTFFEPISAVVQLAIGCARTVCFVDAVNAERDLTKLASITCGQVPSWITRDTKRRGAAQMEEDEPDEERLAQFLILYRGLILRDDPSTTVVMDELMEAADAASPADNDVFDEAFARLGKINKDLLADMRMHLTRVGRPGPAPVIEYRRRFEKIMDEAEVLGLIAAECSP